MKLTGSALIMAGGQGKRIGFDKKLLTIGGKSVLAGQIETLSALFDELIVSSNTPFEYKGVITVEDTLGAGPLAGLYRALGICSSEYLFVTACDMPYLSPEYIRFLLELTGKHDCDIFAAAREDGFIEPFNALYHKRILTDVEESLNAGKYRVQPLLKKCVVYTITPAMFAPFNRQSSRGDMFFNINYSEDLPR